MSFLSQYTEVLHQFSTMVDVGLVILIWMVQLIVYPSFKFYERENLVKWHNLYTGRIAVIVVPLMFYQLIFGFYEVFQEVNENSIIRLIIILILWIYTFTSFAPLHQKISINNFDSSQLIKLIKINWIRTILWTLLLFL